MRRTRLALLSAVIIVCCACGNLKSTDCDDVSRPVGYSIDSITGDIHYIDSKGIEAKNIKVNGVYFAPDGTMINYGTNNKAYFTELSERYESGETIELSLDDSIAWIQFYADQYRLDEDDLQDIHKYQGPRHNEIAYTFNIGDNTYDKEYIKQVVFNRYGHLNRNKSNIEKCREALDKIGTSGVYDGSYMNAKLDKAIERKRMVCWHVAKIFKILMEDAGVETEALTVKTSDEYHEICRWKDENNKWHYSDPTYFIAEEASEDAKNASYDISSDTFNDRYAPVNKFEPNSKGVWNIGVSIGE